ncbi:MAG: hypothetical protein AAF799_10320 [Myxococcota bacterium]
MPAPVRTQSRCEACGEDASVDVSYDSVATTLCESELATRSSTGTPWLLIAGSAFVSVALVAIGVAEGWTAMHFAWLAMPLLPSLGVVAAITRDRRVRRPSRPRRWSWVEAPPSSTFRERSGTVTGRSPLRAPMSGRECLAYEVAIAPAGVTPKTDADWVVREQRATRLCVDGLQVEGTDVALVVDPTAPTRFEVEPTALARYLRERGVMAASDSFDVYEAIVAPHARVTLQQSEGTAVGRLRLVSSPASVHPSSSFRDELLGGFSVHWPRRA